MTKLAVAFVLVLAATTASAQSRVSAVLISGPGGTVAGSVAFVQEGSKVMVVADVTGLKPGPHGFHVHEKGDCSAADFTSAGGHFNPGTQQHGEPSAAAHHVGDMPMLVADASGKATLKAELSPMTIGSGTTDIAGKSVVVHADADDFKSQPAGNSGARIACGVIR